MGIKFCYPLIIISGLILFSARLTGQEITTKCIGKESANVIYPALTVREGLGLNIPTPPNEHPRLFFRKRDIPELQKKTTNPLLEATWNKLVQYAASPSDGRLVQNGNKPNIDNEVINAIEAKAFFYAYSNDLLKGKQAVNAIFNFDSLLIVETKRGDYCREMGRVILTNAIVYDWCYDLLSLPQKKILINKMETLATMMEIEWPKLVQGSITGHGTEAQVSREMLSAGIAVYNEKPEIYNLAAGRIFAEFLPSRNFFQSASYHHQGSSYGHYRYLFDMYITMIYDKMGYPEIFGKDQALVPYHWIYTRRPDGELLRVGDDFTEVKNDFGKYWLVKCNAFTGSYFKDPVLMNEAIRHKGTGTEGIFDFLFINPSVPADKDVSTLPLSRYFKEPLGEMVARTGWDEGVTANPVVAQMKIGVYNFGNHQHLDAGNFQIYYKGPLTVDSGIYEGINGAYGSDHFLNYYQRTIAHNSMLIYDPREKFFFHETEIANDGGQQYRNKGLEPKNLDYLLANGYKTGEVLAHDLGPDTSKPEYSYLKGELAEAYNGKVKSFKRSFVFLNLNNSEVPAALIVFDRVNATDKSFNKYWLLHCVEEPTITGNVTKIQRSGKGYNGQLVNTTLLPNSDNLIINKIGGKDKEFMVFGKNYAQYIRSDKNCSDKAIWRIEVSPQKAENVDNFLNVMQVMDFDGGNKKPLLTEKVETDNLAGAKIGNRIVLFSKNGDLVSGPVKINVKEPAKILITDLAKGNWKVVCVNGKKAGATGGSPVSPGIIKNDKQLLYFEAGKGTYLLTKQ